MTKDRLSIMFDMQRELQLKYNNGKPMDQFTDDERMPEIRNNTLSCVAELFEALAETGWKPWASSNHTNRDAFYREMVDAWHFFMNLMLHTGMTPDDLYAGYIDKNQVNHRRITDGYDGRKDKCPACKRAYGEPGVQCTPADPGWSDPRLAVHADEVLAPDRTARGPWCHELYPDGPASPSVSIVHGRCPQCQARYGRPGVQCQPHTGDTPPWCQTDQTFMYNVPGVGVVTVSDPDPTISREAEILLRADGEW